MRYANWVSDVFAGFVKAAEGRYDFSLSQVAEAMGFTGLDWDAFAKHEGVGEALMVAAYDLEGEGLVKFENISNGNQVTPFGRDVAEAGIEALWPAFSAITLRADEEAFLARLYEVARAEEADWATLGGAETPTIYHELHPELDDYQASMELMKLVGDLDGKGLIRRHLAGPTMQSYRPTYRGVVRISQADARDQGLDAGLLDWSTPTVGFEAIEDRLAELKTKLAAARTDDELSDIGLRSRAIASAAVEVVFRVEMVPAGEGVPSPQDAKRCLDFYLKARLGGGGFAEFRGFLKASLALAHSRTHSARTGYAAAVASAQGVLSFVRALEAIERSVKTAGDPEVKVSS